MSKQNFNQFCKVYNDIIDDGKIHIKMVIADPIFPFENQSNEKFSLQKLLNEDKNRQINIGNSAVGYLKSKLKSEITQVDMDILERKIWFYWPHYDDFYINCRNCELFLLETDFSNPNEAKEKIYQFLNHDIDKDNLFNVLKSSMINTYGLSLPLSNNQFIILIDKKCKKNSTKIMHQFTHFVQQVTGEFKLENKNLTKNISKHFELNWSQINYIFNQNQFWPNIYNDLFNGLQKIYQSFHSKILTWEEFIQSSLLSTNQQQFKKSIIYKQWMFLKINNSWYLNVLAAISYADKKFFNEVVEKLKND